MTATMAMTRGVAAARLEGVERAAPLVWLAVAPLVGCVFFATEHDLVISQREAHAQVAEEMEQIAAGGNTGRRVAMLLLAASGMWLAHQGRASLRCGALGALMIAYLAWCAASVFWSHEPDMTVRRFSVLTCGLIGAFGLSRRLDLSDVLRLGIAVTAGYAVVGLAVEASLGTFRPWLPEYRFGGTVHPNTQSAYLAFLSVLAFYLSRETRRYRVVLLMLAAAALGLLVLTKSRTSLAGALAVLPIVATLRLPAHIRLLGWSAAIFVLALGGGILILGGVDPEQQLAGAALLGREEQVESLTGRLPIWEELSWYVAERPLLGYGYDSFWTPEHIAALSQRLQWGIREAHCAYIESVLSVGLVGTALLLLVVIVALRKAAAHGLRSPGSAGIALIGLLIFALINALLESGMVAATFLPFLLTCGVFRMAFWDDRPEALPANAALPDTPPADDRASTPGFAK